MPDGLVPLPPLFVGPTAATALALVRSPLLSIAGKLRAALEPVLPPRSSPNDESVRAFMARRFGAELADAVIEPLLGGIYGQQTDRLSAHACLPRLRELEAQHGSVLLGIRRTIRANRRAGAPVAASVTLREGMASLPQALAARLAPRIVLRTPVRALHRHGTNRFALTTPSGTLTCNAVILATPAWATAPLLATIAPDAAAPLAALEHKAFVCVSLGFHRRAVPHPLDGTGWLRGRTDERPTLACTWASQKWWGRAPDDHVLVRSMLAFDGAPDADFVAAACADLRDVLGVTTRPLLVRVHRVPRATPIYEVGHEARMGTALAATHAAGALALAGNAYAGVGVPDCGASGEAAARGVLQALARSAARAA
jgi:oxygen-dependent protoporphyrinogen oxidase